MSLLLGRCSFRHDKPVLSERNKAILRDQVAIRMNSKLSTGQELLWYLFCFYNVYLQVCELHLVMVRAIYSTGQSPLYSYIAAAGGVGLGRAKLFWMGAFRNMASPPQTTMSNRMINKNTKNSMVNSMIVGKKPYLVISSFGASGWGCCNEHWTVRLFADMSHWRCAVTRSYEFLQQLTGTRVCRLGTSASCTDEPDCLAQHPVSGGSWRHAGIYVRMPFRPILRLDISLSCVGRLCGVGVHQCLMFSNGSRFRQDRRVPWGIYGQFDPSDAGNGSWGSGSYREDAFWKCIVLHWLYSHFLAPMDHLDDVTATYYPTGAHKKPCGTHHPSSCAYNTYAGSCDRHPVC